MDFKSALLMGRNYRKEISVSVMGESTPVIIRPLTDEEKASLKLSDIAGIDFSDIQIEAGDPDEIKAQFMTAFMQKAAGNILDKASGGKASLAENQKICSLCIMGEDGTSPAFTLQEVKDLFVGGITETIADEIRRISGLEEEAGEALDNFHE